MIEPRNYQKDLLEYIRNHPEARLIFNGRRPRPSIRQAILQIIWAIGTASSEEVHLLTENKTLSEVYRSILTIIFPGCVIRQENTMLVISTQCVRDTIEGKGAEPLKNIEQAIQKSVAQFKNTK